MAIEDILHTLEEEAARDCEAVLDEARVRAAEIAEAAEREAASIRDELGSRSERTAKRAAERLVNSTRLEAKMTVSSAKGAAVDGVFDAAAARLATVRSAPGYDDLFAALAAEALGGVTGEVVLRVASQDAERAKRAAAVAGLAASIDATLPTAGGLVVEARGGRVVRRNTLEDRLERARQLVQADVAEVLFS